MDILQYSGRSIHRSGQIPAQEQDFDPSVAALVSSMRQDLVPDSSTPIPNGYSSFSPNSTQMDVYSAVSPPEFRGQVSHIPNSGYQLTSSPYDYRQDNGKVGKHRQDNGRTSPVVYGRGFMISGTPSPREGKQKSAQYHHHQPHHPQQDDGLINNNSSYVTYNNSPDYSHSQAPTSMAPQNGYVSSPVPPPHHPVSTYREEIQFGQSGTQEGAFTPAQLCQKAAVQNGVGTPEGVAIQPKPPTSLKPRGSRTRRSLRRAADMLLNRSRQSMSDTEGKVVKPVAPTPPPPSTHRAHSPADVSNGDNRAPSIRDRLQKNRARMGELLRSPSLSKWRRGSKENLAPGEESPHVESPATQSATSPAYVPNRRYRSAENLHSPSYTSYETPDPFLDSRIDHSYHDSSDGMSSRSVDSSQADYSLHVHNSSHNQSRRHSTDHNRTRSKDRGTHRGYHTADSDTDSSYSRHDGMNGDIQSRYSSKRQPPSSLRLLSKGNRDGPLRATPRGPSGPLKADHSIQPFTREKRSPDTSPRDRWSEQGARPKHYSSTDSLETEQVTHIVFQDTPIRNDSDDKSSNSRPTTPSALRKSSRPPSPSRSVRFDDDTDGSYDSDRKDRRAQSRQVRERRSESPSGVRNSKRSESKQNGGSPITDGMPVYATVDKSQKRRTHTDQSDSRVSRHDAFTNGVGKEDPYCEVDDGDHSAIRRRNEPEYEEVTFRPRSEQITRTKPQGQRPMSAYETSSRQSPHKESRSSRPSTPVQSDPGYASVDRPSPSKHNGRHESPSRSRPSMDSRGRSYSRESLASYGNPCVSEVDNRIEHLGSSRLDKFEFQSDYDSYKKLSGSQLSIMSRSSISEKVEKTKKKLRRALSLDKLSSSNKDSYSLEKPKLKKSPSLRSLTGLLKKKDKDGESGLSSTDGVYGKRRSASVIGLETTSNGRYSRPQRTSEETDVTSPTHGRKIGRLLAINPDGTQVIELVKPPNGPFGFYIAKGTSGTGNGIFVTRLGDGHPAKILAGLLQVGDEILDINGQDIRRKKLDDVYDLMMDNDALVLKVRPLASRAEYGS